MTNIDAVIEEADWPKRTDDIAVCEAAEKLNKDAMLEPLTDEQSGSNNKASA